MKTKFHLLTIFAAFSFGISSVSAQYVVDIKTVSTSKGLPSVPEGWELVKNAAGQPADLNKGAGGRYVWAMTKSGSILQAITGVDIIVGKGRKISDWTVLTQDLNQGSGGDYLYVAYTRTKGRAPITGLMGLTAKSQLKAGYKLHPTNLNKGTGANTGNSFLSYSEATAASKVTVINKSNQAITVVTGRAAPDGKLVTLFEGDGEDIIFTTIRPGETSSHSRMGAGPIDVFEAAGLHVTDNGELFVSAEFEKRRIATVTLENGEAKTYRYVSQKDKGFQ